MVKSDGLTVASALQISYRANHTLQEYLPYAGQFDTWSRI